MHLHAYRIEPRVDEFRQRELPIAEQSLRTEHHDDHQHHRIHEHAVCGERTQQFRQNRQTNRGDNGTRQRTHTAEHHHDHVIDRLQPTGHAWRERTDILRENTTRNTREERGNRKNEHFHIGDVDAGSASRDLIITNRLDRTTITGTREHEQQHHGHDGDTEHHIQIGETVDADQCLPLLAVRKSLAAGHFQILDDHTNDLTETKRDNRKIIAVQTQCRNADEHTEHTCHHTADERDQQETHRIIHLNAVGNQQLAHQRGGICADRLAAAERKLSEHTDRQIQRRGHDHRNAASHENTLDIQGNSACFTYRNKNAEQHKHANGTQCIRLLRGKH